MGSVNDNANEFMGGETYPTEAVALFIEPAELGITVQEGDYLVIENAAGEQMKVYLPAIESDDPVTLYIGKDGSTYYDSALANVAYVAPGGEFVPVNFQPAAATPPWNYYRDYGVAPISHWGPLGAADYGW